MRTPVAAFVALAVVACGSDNPTEPGGGGLTESTMTAEIDGGAWSAESSLIDAGFSGDVLHIAGTVPGNPSLTIELTLVGATEAAVTSGKTFALGPTTSSLALVRLGPSRQWGTTVVPGSGSVTIFAIREDNSLVVKGVGIPDIAGHF